MKRNIILIFLMSLFLYNCSQQPLDITVYIAPNFKPMEFKEDGLLKGFDIDIMKAIAEKENLKLTFLDTKWEDLLKKIKDNNSLSISAITITEDRDEIVDFTHSYLDGGQILVINKNDAGDIMIIKDLVNKKVGAQKDSSGLRVIKNYPGVIPIDYPNIKDAFEDLKLKKIAGVVVDWPTAAYFVKYNTEFNNKLKMTGAPLSTEHYGIAVKKGNKELLTRLQKGIDKIRQNGELEALIKKWLK